MGEAVMIAGVGCSKGTDGGAVLAAIDAALARHRRQRSDLRALATIPLKSSEPGLSEAAMDLGVPLLVADPAALSDADRRSLTRSEVSIAATGLSSACEAAALAVCGPQSRLLGPRLVQNGVTCAIAIEDKA